jgi:hypothetical protein
MSPGPLCSLSQAEVRERALAGHAAVRRAAMGRRVMTVLKMHPSDLLAAK